MQEIMTYPYLIMLCFFLGLAPFTPPHIVEKLVMLKNGTLKKPIDIFDLLMHSTPFALLGYKLIQDFVL